MSKEPAKGKSLPPIEAPPFSRPFTVEELLRRPDEAVKIVADPAERAALAATDNIPSIAALSAEFKVAGEGKNIRVRGQVRATVTQECVVTLEPFDTDVVEDVDVRFASAPPPAAPEPKGGERMSRRRASQIEMERHAAPAAAPVFPQHEEDDPPDTIVDGKIDLGALAAEFMALALDPYPRKPGAQFAPVEAEPPERDPSPFAGLARLKKDQ
ncbi:MAG: DUF177 domain-containing protein [Beijerinckiaceae bacterium]|nr:DUF177 domain-containing protein [Beijerinckiaceae bacterium]